ncbi:hypothetical protein [Micromonospora rhizosphaerae]|uniref:hypothetical protein n=1 Tax=Micromonospora rhizosphaerae TaxID=568872 RepID=UPI001FDED10C|nr:hypothetical protein [Micromonospora rhizosphaerae]
MPVDGADGGAGPVDVLPARDHGGRGDRGRRLVRTAYALFPRPAVVCFLATSPAVAQRRVLARGIDTEELAHLRALDAAYRALPEFGSFVVVDGDGGPDDVAAALDGVVGALVDR